MIGRHVRGALLLGLFWLGAAGCKGSGPSCGEGTHEENGKCVVGSPPAAPTGDHAVQRPTSADALRAKLVELFGKGDKAGVRALVFSDDELKHACADPEKTCRAQIQEMLAKQTDAPKLDDAQLEAAAQQCAKQANQLVTDTRDASSLTELADREKRPADDAGRAEMVKSRTSDFDACFKVDWAGGTPMDPGEVQPVGGCAAHVVGGVGLMTKDNGYYLKIEAAIEIDGQFGLMFLPRCIEQI